MVKIKEVKSNKERKAFAKFPFLIYKDSPYWIPPIIQDEIDNFDPQKNPVFKTAEARCFLAYRGNQIVGRIAAIVNWVEIDELNIRKMRFGWFDFIDDVEVSEALLNKVFKIGEAHKLDFVEGPVGFSNLDKVGVLTEGFDHIGTMMTWYNHAYYASHIERLGFIKEKEYLESKFLVSDIDAENFTKASTLIQKRYKLTPLNFTKSSEIIPWVDEMFDLFNRSYSQLSSFVKVTHQQKEFFKNKYIRLVNPRFIKFVFDENKRLVGFAIVMPSFSRALQKANGKLFPFGFYHLMKAKRKNDEAVFFLIGIDPEYRNKGVTAIIFDAYYKSFVEHGIKMCIRTPELADNEAIHKLWRHFNPSTHKKRSTYRKELA